MMNVLLTGTTCFYVLWRVAQPQNWLEKLLISLLGVAFLVCFIGFGWFFMLDSLFTRNVFFYLPLMYISPKLQGSLCRLVRRGTASWARRKARHDERWQQTLAPIVAGQKETLPAQMPPAEKPAPPPVQEAAPPEPPSA